MVNQTLVVNNNDIKASLHIATAAVLWGTIGIFGKVMIESGISPEATGCIKLLGSSILLFVYLINGRISSLKIRWNDVSWLLLMAFLTQSIFNFTYYPVVKLMGVTQAGVLLYTMPIFLTIWSVSFFKEKMTSEKMIGIVLCFLGSMLAITGGVISTTSFSIQGVILGIIAAISFSMMSVFTKILLKRMNPLTIIFYAFLFGGLMMLPFIDVKTTASYFSNTVVIASAIGICLIGSVLPYVLYFRGIEIGIDLSKAGVISVLELVTSIILAILFFREQLTFVKFIGVTIIILSIYIIQRDKNLT